MQTQLWDPTLKIEALMFELQLWHMEATFLGQQAKTRNRMEFYPLQNLNQELRTPWGQGK